MASFAVAKATLLGTPPTLVADRTYQRPARCPASNCDRYIGV